MSKLPMHLQNISWTCLSLRGKGIEECALTRSGEQEVLQNQDEGIFGNDIVGGCHVPLSHAGPAGRHCLPSKSHGLHIVKSDIGEIWCLTLVIFCSAGHLQHGLMGRAAFAWFVISLRTEALIKRQQHWFT